MKVLTDRTREIEQKLRAIYIDTQDGCSFWKVRKDTMIQIHQCWYCEYGQFNRENPDVHQNGLCKFKR